MKDECLPIPAGQASRLSDNSWRRHLLHFQLLAGYYYKWLYINGAFLGIEKGEKDV
jgi:hypothetical protein